MRTSGARRPAVNIARDLLQTGGFAEFCPDGVRIVGAVPAWLVDEVSERRLDLLALHEEFTVTPSASDVAAAAEQIVRPSRHPVP